MLKFLIPALFTPWIASAQGLRPEDRMLSASDIINTLGGRVITFYDGSTAEFAADGGYRYIYQPGDPPFVGSYEAGDDSRICVTFDNGFDRCDSYVLDGERLVLITADGTRFPVKSVSETE